MKRTSQGDAIGSLRHICHFQYRTLLGSPQNSNIPIASPAKKPVLPFVMASGILPGGRGMGA